MFNVVLVNPEIPPNTGNVIRLCANSGCSLHLIRPLGFPIDHAKMRRAGLDYHEFADLRLHDDWESFLAAEQPRRRFALTTRGLRRPSDCDFDPGDWLVFGSETAGLSVTVMASFEPVQTLRLPMRPGNRSMNLSNAVAIVVYEAWRQNGFTGGS
ncbi:MAG: tRNA (cytidine(34)-2'-O)-methyltransferase [Lautropia sp.]|nr:tRNA (cytidine(34)-2'-O)-methyltransferase [Lautropia sp.]